VLGMAIMVGEAGHATTIRALTSAFYYLARDAELRHQLIENPGLVAPFVEEILRLESPVQMFVRTVTEDVEFAGHDFVAGDKVGLLFGSANRDESVFANADQIDLDRKPNPHVAFGLGIHRCVGEPLARREMNSVITTVLERLPEFRLDPGRQPRWVPGHARELDGLWVLIGPGHATPATNGV